MRWESSFSSEKAARHRARASVTLYASVTLLTSQPGVGSSRPSSLCTTLNHSPLIKIHLPINKIISKYCDVRRCRPIARAARRRPIATAARRASWASTPTHSLHTCCHSHSTSTSRSTSSTSVTGHCDKGAGDLRTRLRLHKMQQHQQQQQQQQEVDVLRHLCAGELRGLSSDMESLKATFFNRRVAQRHSAEAALARLRAASVSGTAALEADTPNAVGLRRIVAAELLDPSTTMPLPVDTLHKKILAGSQAAAYRAAMAALHQPCLSQLVALLAQQHLLACEMLEVRGATALVISQLARAALAEYAGVPDPVLAAALEQQPSERLEPHQPAKRARSSDNAVEDLLTIQSAKQREQMQRGEELLELLDRRTALQQAKLDKFSMGGAAVQEPCRHVTKEDCWRANNSQYACSKLHKRKVIRPHTVESLGNCNFMDSCNNYRTCKYVHWEDDPQTDQPSQQQAARGRRRAPQYLQALQEPQWINCDIRGFDWSILGKFGVIMTDPPWRIHQRVPYGTMSDDELRGMNLGQLQDDGVIFMWVTGRALELGRELLHTWGYKRVDELIWLKINSLRRPIIAGRTGHWLNHSKEHCLVGYKGKPNINRFVDVDVVVSEVRETSRKPDEMYPLLERLSPGTRKLEIFARQHNIRPGWIAVGNQLDGCHITDPELLQRYTARYGRPVPPSAPPVA